MVDVNGSGSRIPRGATRPAERAPARRPPRRAASRVVLSAVVMTFAAGLVATLALPSYAFDPASTGAAAGGATGPVAWRSRVIGTRSP